MSLNIERLNDDIGYYERNLAFHKKLKADIESCELIQKLSAMPNLKVDIEYPNQGRNFSRNFVGYTVHFMHLEKTAKICLAFSISQVT